MSFSKLFALLMFMGVTLALTAESVPAADITPSAPAAPMIVGDPGTVGNPGCATCQSGYSGGGTCATCGKLFTGQRLHKSNKRPYPVNLCPGACFGYFQTQWRKWDEVCPYPYLGMGPNANLNLKVPPEGMTPPGGLAPPRPLDGKMPDPKKVGSDVPPIPVVPNKFGP